MSRSPPRPREAGAPADGSGAVDSTNSWAPPESDGGSLWWHCARRTGAAADGGGGGLVGGGTQPKPNYGAIKPQPRPAAAPGSGEAWTLVRS